MRARVFADILRATIPQRQIPIERVAEVNLASAHRVDTTAHFPARSVFSDFAGLLALVLLEDGTMPFPLAEDVPHACYGLLVNVLAIPGDVVRKTEQWLVLYLFLSVE